MLGVGSGIFSDPVYQDVLGKDPHGVYAALKAAQMAGQAGGECAAGRAAGVLLAYNQRRN